MNQYEALPGFARLGGRATFVAHGPTLRTTSIEYGGVSYVPGSAEDDRVVKEGLAAGKWSGWKLAEKAILSSLLAQTNLVLHVTLIHLELASVFQAVALSAFTSEPTHPWRRLLDPFTHRSIQVTNPNLDLLFAPEQRAGTFTLAPLPVAEQLRLIRDNSAAHPASIKSLHMEEFAASRQMGRFSSPANGSDFSWRWHYRAATVQRLLENLISCWIDANYPDDTTLLTDPIMLRWWADLQVYMPAVSQTLAEDAAWLSDGELTRQSLTRLASTVFLWVSWIHEDVGHAASYFVYNPTHTPMQVPADGGPGIPLNSFSFNTDAYRTFVFLERAKLLDPPPSFWFSPTAGDEQCYVAFQAALRHLGANDTAFSECGQTGFYSCVEDVETAVSS